MTGAQWMCLLLIPAGVWILWKVRPRLAALAAAEGGDAAVDAGADDAQDDDAPAEVASDTPADADDAGIDAAGAADPAAADEDATVRPAER
jgi:hypothetical protein